MICPAEITTATIQRHSRNTSILEARRSFFDAFGPGSLNRQQINLWQFVQLDHFNILFSPGAGESRLRYYFDDEIKPRIDISIDEFFGGSKAPFGKPFAFVGSFEDQEFKDLFDSQFVGSIKTQADREGYKLLRIKQLTDSDFKELISHFSPEFRARLGDLKPTDMRGPQGKAFAVQYYPLRFGKRLKIAFIPSLAYKKYIASLEGRKIGTSWYQFTYLLYPPDTHVSSWAKDEPLSDKVRDVWGHTGDDPKPTKGNAASHALVAVPPHQTAVLVDYKGQGSIASLKLHMTPYSEENFYNVRIRMSWDVGGTWGGAPNAVDMPIGVFFGGGAKDYADRSTVPFKKLANLFYGFDGGRSTFYSYWPMPFWLSARIEIINDTATPITIDAEIQQTPKEHLNYPVGDAGYFHAKETNTSDAGDGLYAPVFREQGRGHVAGIGFYSEDYSMDGDEFTYLDGSRTPQIHGDGTEDDHNQGWGGAGYQQPLWGGVVSGIQGAYRIYLSDPYIFNDQISINYEYSRIPARTNSKTDVVIFYYKSETGLPRLIQTDAVDVGIPDSEKAHGYSIVGPTWAGALRSAFDGYEKNVEANSFIEEGRAFNGSSAFTIAVDPANVGVRLRRLLARSGNGLQSAQVYVDGAKVERLWHVVFNSAAPANQAWVESDFELPASLTHGKSKLKIEVRHITSTRGELNEFHYWVFSHVPPNHAP